MVAPSGCSGVQRRPNSGQSGGRRRPWSTRPLRHSAGSLTSSPPRRRRARRRSARTSARSASPLSGISPSPRHFRSATTNTSSTIRRAAVLPSRRHHARVGVLDPARAGLELAHRGQHAVQEVERLEPGDDDGDPIARGQRLVVAVARDGADVAGCEEALDPRRRDTTAAPSSAGGTSTCATITAKLSTPSAARSLDRHRVGRGRRLEAHGEEHDAPVGVLPRDLQRVQRRVHDAHVAALGLHREQVLPRARHAEHVAEGAEDHARPAGDAPPRGR